MRTGLYPRPTSSSNPSGVRCLRVRSTRWRRGLGRIASPAAPVLEVQERLVY